MDIDRPGFTNTLQCAGHTTTEATARSYLAASGVLLAGILTLIIYLFICIISSLALITNNLQCF